MKVQQCQRHILLPLPDFHCQAEESSGQSTCQQQRGGNPWSQNKHRKKPLTPGPYPTCTQESVQHQAWKKWNSSRTKREGGNEARNAISSVAVSPLGPPGIQMEYSILRLKLSSSSPRWGRRRKHMLVHAGTVSSEPSIPLCGLPWFLLIPHPIFAAHRIPKPDYSPQATQVLERLSDSWQKAWQHCGYRQSFPTWPWSLMSIFFAIQQVLLIWTQPQSNCRMILEGIKLNLWTKI